MASIICWESVFDEVNELIQRHIDDARVVDEKLDGAISQVKAVNY